MSVFDRNLARKTALSVASEGDEKTLVPSFVEICQFLSEFPNELSWRSSKTNPKPSVFEESGLVQLANRYFESYRRSDFPAVPSTVPDEMVSVIMHEAYGYSEEDCERIKAEHQHSMWALFSSDVGFPSYLASLGKVQFTIPCHIKA